MKEIEIEKIKHGYTIYSNYKTESEVIEFVKKAIKTL